MHISRLAVGAVIAVMLSGNAIAGAIEDCAAAYDRKDYAAALFAKGFRGVSTMTSGRAQARIDATREPESPARGVSRAPNRRNKAPETRRPA